MDTHIADALFLVSLFAPPLVVLAGALALLVVKLARRAPRGVHRLERAPV